MSFKSQHPLEKRKEVAERMRKSYPERIPVIVEKAEGSDAPDIEKKRFLVPADITVGKFIFEIRKHMKLGPEKTIFLYVNQTLPPPANLMSTLYEEHKDEDGFLYIKYTGENFFGHC